MQTRRDVLAGFGAAVFFASQSLKAQESVSRSRESAHSPRSQSAIASYRRAVRNMLDRPPSDPLNWYRQALIHILDCPHDNWWFLPWHRGYLHRFEQICAAASGDSVFALPFWDWTLNPTLPPDFFDGELNPDSSSFKQSWADFRPYIEPVVESMWAGFSQEQMAQQALRGRTSAAALIGDVQQHFAYAEYDRELNQSAPRLPAEALRVVEPNFMARVLDARSFERFASPQAPNHHARQGAGMLESGPHNNVHGFTGGVMGAHMSPVDPVFWLHHANLDRLWEVWTRRRLAGGQPALPAGAAKDRLDQAPFLFFTDATGTAETIRAADCLNISALGYRYGPGWGDDLGAQPPGRTFSLMSQRFRSQSVEGNFRFGIEAFATVSGLREVIAETRNDPGANLVATIELDPPANAADVHVRVYMNCPYLSRFTPVEDDHYVGTISFFSHIGHSDHSGRASFTLPLEQTLARLAANSELVRAAIRIQLIPISASGEEIEQGELTNVTIDIG